jgi:hypothetical protein
LRIAFSLRIRAGRLNRHPSFRTFSSSRSTETLGFRVPPAQLLQTHATPRASGGRLSITSGGIDIEKHQQVEAPLTMPHSLVAPHRGQRAGSISGGVISVAIS